MKTVAADEREWRYMTALLRDAMANRSKGDVRSERAIQQINVALASMMPNGTDDTSFNPETLERLQAIQTALDAGNNDRASDLIGGASVHVLSDKDYSVLKAEVAAMVTKYQDDLAAQQQ